MHRSLQPIQSIHWCHCNPRTRIHCCHCWSQSWQKYPSAIMSIHCYLRTRIHCLHCKCKCIFRIQHIVHIFPEQLCQSTAIPELESMHILDTTYPSPIMPILCCSAAPRTRIHCCHCWSQSWQKYPPRRLPAACLFINRFEFLIY